MDEPLVSLEDAHRSGSALLVSDPSQTTPREQLSLTQVNAEQLKHSPNQSCGSRTI